VSPNPVRAGTKVELTAHVTPAGATGTVTFLDAAVPIGSSLVDGSGLATLSITTFTAGSHSLTAQYGGDACRAGSTSAPVSLTVTPDALPVVTVNSPNGGEVVSVGSNLDISWTATDDGSVASVSLSVSRDNGTTWEPIATDIPNSGSYTWTVTPPWANTSSTPVYSALIKVEAKDDAGQIGSDTSDAPFAIYGNWLLGVGDVPREFSLSGAWPNPSHGQLSLSLALPKASPLRLSIVDLQGREVAVIADGTFQPGRYSLKWDGRTNHGSAAAGVYFARYVSPEQKLVRRFVLAH
jgi:hypothetical protein